MEELDSQEQNKIEDVTVALFETDGISKHIEYAFTNFASEKPFDLTQCQDIALAALPDTVLLRIFSNLSQPELCRIALVCKHWLWVVYDSELWKFLDLSRCNKINEKQIIQLIQARLSPLLKTLDLSNCNFSPTIFHELTDNCQQLDTLVLQNSSLEGKEEENQLDLLSVPDNLVRLDIRNIKDGFRFMHVILEAHDMSKLECFGFGNNHFCPAFTDFQVIFSKMHSLRILECIGIESLSDTQIRNIADQLKLIESLDLKKCKNINGSSLAHLIKYCKFLKSVNLSGTGVNDFSLSTVTWEESILEEFDLSFCDYVTSDGLIQSLPRITNLQHLALNNTGRGKAMSGEVLEAVFSAETWTDLEVFSLHFSNRLFSQAFTFLRNCSALQRLSLRTCYHINYVCIAENLKHFPNLTGLECGSLFASEERNYGQWVELLTSIGSYCKNIQDVILVKCLGMSISKATEYRNTVMHALEKCTKLKNMAVLYSEEAIFNLIENCVEICNRERQHPIKVDTAVSCTIIPTFRHSLDSEINKQKFKNYFGY